MAGRRRKGTTSAPPADNSKEQEPQQQDEIPYSSEFLGSEGEMIRAEQEMSELEVS